LTQQPVRIRALVVDDEQPARDLLTSLLKSDTQVDLAGTCASGQDALSFLKSNTVDLMFLDIQMPGLSGFDVIRRMIGGSLPVVIFVTAHDEFALQAFEVHALDYLLKPFPKKRFFAALERAKKQISSKTWQQHARKLQSMLEATAAGPVPKAPFIDRFKVQAGSRLFWVEAGKVSLLESADHYTRLWVDGQSHLIPQAISALEEQLDPTTFVRIHRTRIVNVHHVDSVRTTGGSYAVVMQDGKAHNVSRARKDVLMRLLPDGP
jgi:two-component system LytT family response regulator